MVQKLPRQIRLCCIGFPFNYPTAGRLFKFLSHLSTEYDLRVDIITPNNWNGYSFPDIDKYSTEKFIVHKSETLNFDFRKPYAQFKFIFRSLRETIRRINPDVIYGFGEPVALQNFHLANISRKTKAKLGYQCWENMIFKHLFFVNWMERYTISKADFLIPGTDEIKKIYLGKGAIEEKMYVLPEAGIDIGFYKPLDKGLSGFSGKKGKTFLFLGRLIDVKGILTILKAVEILEAKGEEFSLLIVGFGKANDQKIVEEVRKFSAARNNVKLMEDLENKQVPIAYNTASFFVFPSIPNENWREQFGYTVIEAMSCGIPVISTFSGGPATMIEEGKNGFVINPGNAEALADRIRILLNDKILCSKMGEYSRKYVIENFRIEATAKRFYSILCDVLKK